MNDLANLKAALKDLERPTHKADTFEELWGQLPLAAKAEVRAYFTGKQAGLAKASKIIKS